jgi:hypothetical protein
MMRSYERLTLTLGEHCASPPGLAEQGVLALRRLAKHATRCLESPLAAAILWLAAGNCGVMAAAPFEASSSREAQIDAAHSIPFDQLSEQTRRELWQVVSKPSIFRRMPVQIVDCDPDLYVFLVRYPEVVVNMWRLMGVTKADVRRTGQFTFDANDGAGTAAKVQLLYASPEKHVLYAEGIYEGPLLKQRVDGKCVLVLTSGYSVQENDRVLVTHRLDVFLQLDHPGAELLAKTLHPLVGKAADHNFAESTAFLGTVSQAAERNGPGMEQFAARLTRVAPEVRERFASLAASVGYKAVLRHARPARLKTQPDEPIAAAFRIASAEIDSDDNPPEICRLSQLSRRRDLQMRR